MQKCLSPSTFEYLEYRACINPGKIALATQSRTITYLNFYQDAVRFSIALKDMGVSKGSLVIVMTATDIYLHWLLLLACENNGAISVSCPDVNHLKFISFLNEIDFLITESTKKIDLDRGYYFIIDTNWLNKVFGMVLSDNSYPFPNLFSLEDAQRITHSSGTTGGQKAMILTHGAQEQKLRFLAENLHLCNEDSCLITTLFSVNATYLYATHFLRLGLLIVFGQFFWALQKFPITYFEIFPITLGSLLNTIPNDFIKPKKLTIRVTGAPLSSDLEKKSLLTLCTDISGRYAANEAWPIAYEVNPKGIGTIVPGVRIKILDESGAKMAKGGTGQIAVKSLTMIHEYYKNADATAACFADGYFLTGDIGRLLPSRKLQIIGRGDDVLNLGGRKNAPDPIEAKLRNIDGVIDVAVTSIFSDQWIDDLCIAVVIKNDSDPQTIVQQIKAYIFSIGWRRGLIKFLNSLPKTENGKLSRKMLRQMFMNSETDIG